MTRPRPHQPANDNAVPTGSPVLANADAPNDKVVMKNILSFFELLDGWDRAANDNVARATNGEATEARSHER